MVIPYYYYTTNNSKYKNIITKLLTDLEYDYNFTKVSKKKYKETISNIVYNCVRCVSGSKLTVMLRAEFFSNLHIVNGVKCKLPITRTYFLRCINWMVENEYLHLYKSEKKVYDDDGRERGRESSVITVLDKMLNLLEGKEVVHKPNNVCILKENNEEVCYTMTPLQEKIISVLNIYNDFVTKHEFVSGDGELIREPYLRRIFNNTFERGGRFYTQCAVIQGMPSVERKKITIDGSKVMEIDVKSIHPAILYTEEGVEMPEDPYDFHVPCGVDWEEVKRHATLIGKPNYNPVRNYCKYAMLVVLNCDNLNSAKKALVDAVRKDKRKEDVTKRKFVGVDAFSHDVAIENMKDHNMMIRDHFHTGAGIRLQYRDSTFMEKLLMFCVQDDIVVSPVHDSVLCKGEDVSKVVKYMRRAFDETFGSVINFKYTVE